jgi:hypothetical protein
MNATNSIIGTAFLLATLQASGADVSFGAGLLAIGGQAPVELNKLNRGTQLVGTTTGFSVTRTLTATIAANTSYSLGITQWTPAQTYEVPIVYEVGASAPGAAAFYAAVAAKIQACIDANQILGTVSSSSAGVVFTPALAAPQLDLTTSSFSVALGAATLTAAGSSATNAAPRVLTAGAAHNLTVGGVYRISFSGVTGAGAADLEGRILYGIPTGATTIALLGTSATGAVVTTSATMTVIQDATSSMNATIGNLVGYNSTHQYVGVLIPSTVDGAIDLGANTPNTYVCDVTNNTVANVNSFLNAIIAALNGSSPAAFIAQGTF